MKKFRFIYEDRKGNELQSEIKECASKKNAMQWAVELLANSMMNDLFKIKTIGVK